MSKISLPKLISCRFCGDIPQVRINEGDKNFPRDNPMYSFSINHRCGGFEGGHLSLFFQNKSTRRSCMKTLRQSVMIYSKEWNCRHNKEGK